MVVRILAASAAEADDRVDSQPESFLVEMRMLAGEDCRGLKAECIKGRGDRFEFYGFWPGPDDQPNISTEQLSPYLGGVTLASLVQKLNGNCRRRPAA